MLDAWPTPLPVARLQFDPNSSWLAVGSVNPRNNVITDLDVVSIPGHKTLGHWNDVWGIFDVAADSTLIFQQGHKMLRWRSGTSLDLGVQGAEGSFPSVAVSSASLALTTASGVDIADLATRRRIRLDEGIDWVLEALPTQQDWLLRTDSTLARFGTTSARCAPIETIQPWSLGLVRLAPDGQQWLFQNGNRLEHGDLTTNSLSAVDMLPAMKEACLSWSSDSQMLAAVSRQSPASSVSTGGDFLLVATRQQTRRYDLPRDFIPTSLVVADDKQSVLLFGSWADPTVQLPTSAHPSSWRGAGILRISSATGRVEAWSASDVCYGAILTHDGKQAVGFDEKGRVHLFDTQSLATIGSFNTDAVSSVSLSPDGSQLLTVSTDHLDLWNFINREHQAGFSGTEVDDVQWLPDNRQFLTSDSMGRVSVYDADQATLLVTVSFLHDLKDWIAITPDGLYDTSPGLANKVDLQVGNHVYPLSVFDKRLHRPDLLKSILAGGRPVVPSEIADAPPPQVSLGRIGPEFPPRAMRVIPLPPLPILRPQR